MWTLRDENPGLGGFHYTASRELYYKYYALIEDYFLAIKRLAISHCRSLHLVSLSDAMRRFSLGVDFLAARPNTIIYNAIAPGSYPLIPKAEARRQLGLADKDVVLSFVCYQIGERRKRLKEVLEALDLLANPRIRLLCVGRCDVAVNRPDVICLGTIADSRQLSAVYAASDVFVSPSAQESFGKTVVEALYCGTPVVSTPIGIAPEVIDTTNGALCDGTPQQIAHAIDQVLQGHYRAADIRARAVALFDPERIARQYIALYDTLVADKEK